MVTTVGGIDIAIGVNTDGLTSGMNKAKSTVKAGVDSIQGAAESMKGYLAALGAGLGVGAFAGWIKGAINAADETGKMAQKIGVATEEVAGLQLAFRQAGVGEVFEQSMAKLSKSAAEGSKAFEAMGINVKDSDGALKSTRALLGEVADSMAGYADGAAKSALAQEIFGKSGAALIPLLNAGAQGLDEYDAMAKKLGLTIGEETAKQAEKFNDTLDLIGQGSQGVGRQIAAQLLPTLSGLADQFFTSMSAGDKLKNTADFLASSMKILYIAGISIVEVFSTVGKTLGGVGAAVVAALSGDFTGAANILKDMKAEIGTGWKDTLKQIEGAWNATGSASVESMASTQRALKGTAPLLADMEKQTKALTKAQKEQEEQQKKADAELMKIMQARAALRQKESDGINAYMLSEEQRRNATVKAANDSVAAAQAEYDNYGKTRSQIAEVTLARLEDKLQAYHAGSDNAAAVMLEIDAQKKLIGILQNGEARDAAKKSADDANKAWTDTAKDIERALTDSLMRGFESGKSVWDSFRDYIVNAAKAMIVKVLVQPIMGQVNSLMGGSGGGSGVGASGSVMGSVGSTVSNAVGSGSTSAILSGVGGSMSVANVGGSVAANMGYAGGGLDGLLATNGAFGTAAVEGGSAAAASGAAGAEVAGGAAAGSGMSAIPIIGAFYLGMKLMGQGNVDGLPSDAELWLAQNPGKSIIDFYGGYGSFGVGGFAAGGDHAGGWRIVGENGPELEATGPSRIFNAEQTASMLRSGGASDSEVVTELRALRAELAAALRDGMAAANATSAQVARSLDGIDSGNRLERAGG